MGESIVEGTLTKWLKKPGERIERDEPLFEISTDKVDTEIPSPAAGVVSEILVEEGKTVGINTVVARIEESGAAAVAPVVPVAPVSSPPPAEPSGPLSPLVRKLAREHNLDLTQVQGTGAGGRITKQDVEAHLAQPTPPPLPAAPPLPPAAAPQPRTRLEPLSAMRIKIAEHMVLSKRTSAHVTTIHRVDMTKVTRMRERSKADFQAAYGFSLTYLPFLVRAAAAALRHFPLLNASLDGNNIVYHNDIDIGIAVALENGLIVPVVRAADEKNVAGLQRAIVDLATRARSRQLKPDEVQGGTFSITNFGSYGSLVGTPIINQPQVAIMGVGTVEKTPVVIDDAIAIRSICLLSLSFDHRLIDGALADQFMTKVKQVLEDWSEEVL
jgi:2-oxoglutarate dehydrogenase E2 component (dihydrolipoamide succinyltransferase)